VRFTGLVQSALPGNRGPCTGVDGSGAVLASSSTIRAGSDHALCERVTAVLRRYLDEYSVEVSSPGPERPLRSPDHFTRAVRPHRERQDADGKRSAASSSRPATVPCKIESGSEPLDIPYSEIVRANLIDEG